MLAVTALEAGADGFETGIGCEGVGVTEVSPDVTELNDMIEAEELLSV